MTHFCDLTVVNVMICNRTTTVRKTVLIGCIVAAVLIVQQLFYVDFRDVPEITEKKDINLNKYAGPPLHVFRGQTSPTSIEDSSSFLVNSRPGPLQDGRTFTNQDNIPSFLQRQGYPNTIHGGGNTNFQKKRYVDSSPFVSGYKSSGGSLPFDAADFLSSSRMWKYVDNVTCLHDPKSDQHMHLLSWQHRAPYAILLGAMKCGTHALTESLWEHPWVAKNRHWELHFFDSDRPIRTDKGIDVRKTRLAYADAFRKASPEFFINEEQRNNNTANNMAATTMMIAMESSPRYLLNSDRLPHLILCVVPWVKFLVLLRDPIARLESQYRYLDETRRELDKPMVDWTTWIEDDIRLLVEAGVLKHEKDETATNSTLSRAEERMAWKRYQRRPNSHMIVGRGLYVLQLLDYFEAMDQSRKPRKDMLILQSEIFKDHRQREYDKVLKFLNLPSHTLQNATAEIHPTQKNTNKDNQTANPMPESIRKQLQEIYRPYNERLYGFLGWDKVWGY